MRVHVHEGRDSRDYEQRVEPSVQGGMKMGHALVDAWRDVVGNGVDGDDGGGGGGGGDGGGARGPTMSEDTQTARNGSS